MGQKTHPYGFRLGVTRPWKSRWWGGKRDFARKLVEDQKIKNYIRKKVAFAGVASLEIERRPFGGTENIQIFLDVERPGLVIGPRGQYIDRLRSEIEKLTEAKIDLKIREVLKPMLNAQLVSDSVATQLVRRGAFRRILARAKDSVMEVGAKGVRIKVSGRLGGADIARSESVNEGAMPLSTLSADVDYGFSEAHTTYGIIGVKVWVYKGKIKKSAAE